MKGQNRIHTVGIIKWQIYSMKKYFQIFLRGLNLPTLYEHISEAVPLSPNIARKII